MYCKNCGKEIDNNAAYCPVCGVSTNTNQPPQSQQSQQPQHTHVTVINNNPGYGYVRKSKWAAFWLCFFLGGLGIHRFYVGKTGTGIICLLTFGLCGVGALIDLIIILCGGFRDKAGQPLA